ncbi:MAG: ATP-binding protein [Pseudomonadota bacterium]
MNNTAAEPRRTALTAAAKQHVGNGSSRWAPMPALAAFRPQDSIDDPAVQAAARVCPTLLDRLRSTPEDVRRALQGMCEAVRRQRLDQTDCITLEIVLAEAMNNVVEHAYREDPSGWILLEVDFLSGWVVCRLTDGGVPMPNAAPPPRSDADAHLTEAQGVDGLPEGGFGWSMIHELTSSLTYRREDERNTLTFALALSSVDTLLPA